MPFGTAMSRLQSALDELDRNVRADLKGRTAVTAQDRRAMRSDIEKCMQQLDELRTMLAG
ncbi:MAG: hypothetical protein KKF33_05695 [Alphaproteobacteria bacterium]|nr:hypothetical protein [Alphaproteobacteria bacterium]